MKKLWVCCDIEGTYNALDFTERFDFFNNLGHYAWKNGFNVVVFSLISSLSTDQVLEYYETNVSPFMKKTEFKNIVSGFQIGSDGPASLSGKRLNNEVPKALQMFDILKDKRFRLNRETSIMYIDDAPNINCDMLLLYLDTFKNSETGDVIFITKDETYGEGKYDYSVEYAMEICKTKQFALDSLKKLNGASQNTR